MEPNRYKNNKEKPERTQIVAVTEAKVQKKSLGKKFKDTFFCSDARDVRDDVMDRVVIPTIKDLIYDIGVGIFEGFLFGGDRRSSRRRRRDRDSKESYTNYYKTGSSSRDRDRDRDTRRRIDLDDILFDKYGGTLDDRDDALNVVRCLKERIRDFDSALVQDVYDLVNMTAPDYLAVEYGWDSEEDLDSGYSINKVRGGYVLSLPPPHRLDK